MLFMITGAHQKVYKIGLAEHDQAFMLATAMQKKKYAGSPALMPLTPAALSPFFLIMKLDPMKKAELQASARPFAWSDDRTAASPGLRMGNAGLSRMPGDPQAHTPLAAPRLYGPNTDPNAVASRFSLVSL